MIASDKWFTDSRSELYDPNFPEEDIFRHGYLFSLSYNRTSDGYQSEHSARNLCVSETTAENLFKVFGAKQDTITREIIDSYPNHVATTLILYIGKDLYQSFTIDKASIENATQEQLDTLL